MHLDLQKWMLTLIKV